MTPPKKAPSIKCAHSMDIAAEVTANCPRSSMGANRRCWITPFTFISTSHRNMKTEGGTFVQCYSTKDRHFGLALILKIVYYDTTTVQMHWRKKIPQGPGRWLSWSKRLSRKTDNLTSIPRAYVKKFNAVPHICKPVILTVRQEKNLELAGQLAQGPHLNKVEESTSSWKLHA